MMWWEHGFVLYETIYGGKTPLQQPGDGLEEPEPKPEDVLEGYSLSSKVLWAEGGSLSVHCSALKQTIQYPGEVFLLGEWSRSLAVCPVSAGSSVDWLCLCLQ